MPDGKEHEEMSYMRTGKKYREVHHYVDKPHAWLGSVHRIERHDYQTLAYILEKYGVEAYQECFYHYMADQDFVND